MAVAIAQTRRCRNCGARVGVQSATCWACRSPMRQDVVVPARPLQPIGQEDESVAFASGLLVGLTSVLVPFTVYLSMTAS